MKIINRQQFLALPPGAICCEGEPWAFQGWFRKGETCGRNDYYLLELDWTQFDNDSSGDMCDKADEVLKTGASLPLTFDGTSRDGAYRDDAIYCVLEDADIDAFVAVLLAGKGRRKGS